MVTIASAVIRAVISFAATAGSTIADRIEQAVAAALPIGSSAGQIQAAFVLPTTTTVVSGSPTTIDLTAVTGIDGSALAFNVVTHIFIVNLSTTSGQDLTLAGGSSNPLFSDSWTIQAGVAGVPSFDLLQCAGVGFAVSGSTKTLKISAAAGTIPFALIVLGR